jgi:molecular chaperone HtpG
MDSRMSEQLQPFEADVSRVLDLVINSLYGHREIFLRELVSNASDACDRLRYLSLSQPELLGDAPEMRIEIKADPEAGTLTVTDNGIGMNGEDLAESLGTVARSGTARFLDHATGDAKQDLKLIGQFGVGFYAAFMVADRVSVISRKAGEDTTWLWASDGRTGFTVAEADASAPRGTSVVLTLKDDAREFLERRRLDAVLRRYSDHIAIPILLHVSDKEPAQVNRASALWQRPRAEITEEQYTELYHHTAHAFDEPYARVHFSVEGRLSYTGLLFVPSMRPLDLFDPVRRHGVKLYVRRVFITDQLDGLVPRYLRFIAGVIDSEDLHLNVSRETLQQNAVVEQMRKGLTRRVLDELERLSRQEGDEARKAYETFWENFGVVLKEGLYEDADNRGKLLELARFRSTATDGWVSLKDYVARMKEGQESILTISGDDIGRLRSSPLLEGCRAKGVEVLLLDDAVDEFWPGVTEGFDGKPFRSLSQGAIDLDAIAADGEAADSEPAVEGESLDRLIAGLKLALGDEVADVRASHRLTESAVCLVAGEDGLDMRLERFLKQTRQLESLSKRILEINPTHPLIRRLADLPDNDPQLADLAALLLDQARITEGEPLPDPGAFSRRMSTVLARAVGG